MINKSDLAKMLAERMNVNGISGAINDLVDWPGMYGPKLNAVAGGKEKSLNPILLDRYKIGKQNRSGKKRRTTW